MSLPKTFNFANISLRNRMPYLRSTLYGILWREFKRFKEAIKLIVDISLRYAHNHWKVGESRESIPHRTRERLLGRELFGSNWDSMFGHRRQTNQLIGSKSEIANRLDSSDNKLIKMIQSSGRLTDRLIAIVFESTKLTIVGTDKGLHWSHAWDRLRLRSIPNFLNLIFASL